MMIKGIMYKLFPPREIKDVKHLINIFLNRYLNVGELVKNNAYHFLNKNIIDTVSKLRTGYTCKEAVTGHVIIQSILHLLKDGEFKPVNENEKNICTALLIIWKALYIYLVDLNIVSREEAIKKVDWLYGRYVDLSANKKNEPITSNTTLATDDNLVSEVVVYAKSFIASKELDNDFLDKIKIGITKHILAFIKKENQSILECYNKDKMDKEDIALIQIIRVCLYLAQNNMEILQDQFNATIANTVTLFIVNEALITATQKNLLSLSQAREIKNKAITLTGTDFTNSKIPKDIADKFNIKTTIVANKTCANCNKNLSIDNFYPSKKHDDGYSKWCKHCLDEANKARSEKAANSKYKVCPHCKRRRLKTSFYKNSNRPDGLTKWCKDCMSRAK